MTTQKRLRRRLDYVNYDNVKYSIFFFSKSILMLMKCLSVARRISGISRLLYVGQHRARSLLPKIQARKQNNARPLSEYQANFGRANTCNFC